MSPEAKPEQKCMNAKLIATSVAALHQVATNLHDCVSLMRHCRAGFSLDREGNIKSPQYPPPKSFLYGKINFCTYIILNFKQTY